MDGKLGSEFIYAINREIMSTQTKTKHIGFQISRIREICGIKQEALAIAMNVSQQTISNIENSKTIKDKKLEEVSRALGVSQEVIKNFSEEIVLSIILNTFGADNITAIDTTNKLQSDFNTLNKIIELYERLIETEKKMLQSEKEKVAYLERLLNK